MRFWRFWFNTFIVSSQYNPPRFVELLMLFLAIALLMISTVVSQSSGKPYMILGLSFVVGASISILVREAIDPSPQTRVTQITAVLLLILSIYGFADILQTL